jgi:hypothetical protein
MWTSSVRVVILISGLSFSYATPRVNIVKTAVMVAIEESSLGISTCLSLTRKKKRRDQQHESKRCERKQHGSKQHRIALKVRHSGKN